jgi:hypothetical protein
MAIHGTTAEPEIELYAMRSRVLASAIVDVAPGSAAANKKLKRANFARADLLFIHGSFRTPIADP